MYCTVDCGLVCVSGGLPEDGLAEMHLQPDPLFSIPSDNVYMTCTTGTFHGRIFTGGKNGCLYEIAYQVSSLYVVRQFTLFSHTVYAQPNPRLSTTTSMMYIK